MCNKRPLEAERNWPLEGALSPALPAQLLLQLGCCAHSGLWLDNHANGAEEETEGLEQDWARPSSPV